MAYPLTRKSFSYWVDALDQVRAGHARSGFPLRPEMYAEVARRTGELKVLISMYSVLERRQAAVAETVLDLQKSGVKALSRARFALLGQLTNGKVESGMRLYQLSEGLPADLAEVVAALRRAEKIAGAETDPALVLPDEITALIARSHSDLDQGLSEVTRVQTDHAEVKRRLERALADAAELRERVYAELIGGSGTSGHNAIMRAYGFEPADTATENTVTAVKKSDTHPSPQATQQKQPKTRR